MNQSNKIAQSIINWFHKYGRKKLPWQIKKNMYKIWISEIMLQQTKVVTVIPYYLKFIKKFPTIKNLSKASLNKILFFWSGLGYYNRAKNIFLTTKIIKEKYNYKFPKNYFLLIKLPGIGKSTAGAILSLANNFFFSILDGNVKRILSRCFLIKEPINKSSTQKKLWKIINNITPIYQTEKFNQGIMDLGATICTYKTPSCTICPINNICLSYKNNQVNQYPKNIKLKKILKKIIFLLLYKEKKIFLKKIEEKIIWKDLFSFPEFQNKQKMLLWIEKRNIEYKKIIFLEKQKFQYTNYKIVAEPILIFTLNKKFEFLEKKKKIWYNLNSKKKEKIAIPSPIKKILNKLKEIKI
ncbi:Adenine DNA glycosylase [Buchnera aphidicola (Tetraneura ulmi)]|uniref:A/G-specific adenine glycosylase n=1 Tax=Buchnera aphidicola TaxID=9 RepID=UPI00346470EB